MIDRRLLERHLRATGCHLVREGAKHSVWEGPTGRRATVPRHRRIPQTTARNICRQMEVDDI